jgi:hypothetical protein
MPPVGGGGGTGGFSQPRYYRPVPGNRSRYYDTATGQEISGYRYRQYRRSLTTDQLDFLRNVSSQTQFNESTLRNIRLVDNWAYYEAARQGATYVPESDRGRALRSQMFQQDYQTLRLEQYNATWRGGDRGPNGPLAAALVEMGLRLPDDPFDVGASPKGHSNTVRALWAMGGYGPMYGAAS